VGGSKGGGGGRKKRAMEEIRRDPGKESDGGGASCVCACVCVALAVRRYFKGAPGKEREREASKTKKHQDGGKRPAGP
jgi:hypothetical protein